MKTMLETIRNPDDANALEIVLATLDAGALSLRHAIQHDNIADAREAAAVCRVALTAMYEALERATR